MTALAVAVVAAWAWHRYRTELPEVSGVSSTERAENAGKRYAGTTLNIAWESGLQALDPLRFSGPLWEQKTGIHINVIEIGDPREQYQRLLEEFQSRTHVFDGVSIPPNWLPEFVQEGALAKLGPFIRKFMPDKDLDDYLPLYRDLGVWDQHRYGLFDDGDVLLLYYRKDLFDDVQNQQAFAAKYKYPLRYPDHYNWSQFCDALEFFSSHRPGVEYGLAPMTSDLEWAWFQALLRTAGEEFFDAETMDTKIGSKIGREIFARILSLKKYSPPSPNAEVNVDTALSSYLSGHAAMATFWPPLGRWVESYSSAHRQLTNLPLSRIAGRTGYSLLPGGATELSVGFVLSVTAESHAREATYLFFQWLTSPRISLERVKLPTALRDPYRESHLTSKGYRSLWSTAPEYLDTLRQAAKVALIDLSIPGAALYQNAFFVALTDVRLGMTPDAAMTNLVAAWNRITDARGRDGQREAYRYFMKQPHARFNPLASEAPDNGAPRKEL